MNLSIHLGQANPYQHVEIRIGYTSMDPTVNGQRCPSLLKVHMRAE